MIEQIGEKSAPVRTCNKKSRIGKDEMNLVELPFALLTSRAPDGMKTINRQWDGIGEDGKQRNFYKIISGSDKWGLPTFSGEELYLACMEVSYNNGFQSRKVPTTQYELLKLMGWGFGGRSYERLIKTFNQLGGVFISTNAFWDREEKRYKKTGFGIIDDYIFDENEKRRKKPQISEQLELPFGNFRWNERFFEDCIQKGNIKTVNTSLYFSLKCSTAKRLYRFVDKKLHSGQSSEIDLFKLAFEKLEMIGKYKYPSKVIEKLVPAIKELEEREIAKISVKTSPSTPSKHKVCISPFKTIIFGFTDKKTGAAKELVQYFHSKMGRKVSTRKSTLKEKELKQAEDLLKKYTKEKCESLVDFAVAEANKTNFDMQFFGAVLLYVGKAFEKEKISNEINQSEASEKKERDLEKQYDVYKTEALNSFISKLPQEKYQKELKRLGEKLCAENPINSKWSEGIFNEIVLSTFQRELLDSKRIELLEFSEWKKQREITGFEGSV